MMAADNALDQAEKRFFAESPVLVCLAGLDGMFIRLGGPWTALLGWTNEELLARRFLDFVHPDDVDKTVAVLDGLGKGLVVARFSNRYRTRAGGWVVLQWDAHAPKNGVVLAVAQDVTDVVQRDAALKRRTAVGAPPSSKSSTTSIGAMSAAASMASNCSPPWRRSRC